jgi:hypothetical protein
MYPSSICDLGSTRTHLSLGGVELHEGDGLQGVHLQVIAVLPEGAFHNCIPQHVGPLKPLVRCAVTLLKRKQLSRYDSLGERWR